jgi:hypothetical protein
VTVPNRFRRMRQSLSDEPHYAVRVKLAGVASVDASSREADTRATFSSLIANQEFQMECVCSDTDVASVRLTNRDDIDLASRLLAEKFVQKLPTAAAHKDTVLDGITLAAVRPSVSQSLRQRISQTQSLLAPLAAGTFNACATGKTATSMGNWLHHARVGRRPSRLRRHPTCAGHYSEPKCDRKSPLRVKPLEPMKGLFPV